MPTGTRHKPLPNIKQILATLRAHMPELRESHGVRDLWVFGSYVRGEAKRKSDLDLLVEFEDRNPLTLFGFVRLERHLSELLGVKVDLVERSVLKPAIGRRILEEIVPI
jgi:predicted nucleotidyltransferase